MRWADLQIGDVLCGHKGEGIYLIIGFSKCGYFVDLDLITGNNTDVRCDEADIPDEHWEVIRCAK